MFFVQCVTFWFFKFHTIFEKKTDLKSCWIFSWHNNYCTINKMKFFWVLHCRSCCSCHPRGWHSCLEYLHYIPIQVQYQLIILNVQFLMFALVVKVTNRGQQLPPFEFDVTQQVTVRNVLEYIFTEMPVLNKNRNTSEKQD